MRLRRKRSRRVLASVVYWCDFSLLVPLECKYKLWPITFILHRNISMLMGMVSTRMTLPHPRELDESFGKDENYLWPSQPPDPNSTEHPWDFRERSVRRCSEPPSLQHKTNWSVHRSSTVQLHVRTHTSLCPMVAHTFMLCFPLIHDSPMMTKSVMIKECSWSLSQFITIFCALTKRKSASNSNKHLTA